jgi:hypothetical protein
MDDVVIVDDEELDNMIEEQDRAEVLENLVPADKSEVAEYTWPEVSPNHAAKYQREVDEVRAKFDAEDEEYDATMCSEYADDIFIYMTDLEVRFHHIFFITWCLDGKRTPLCPRRIIWTPRRRSPGACVRRSLTGFSKSTSAIICFPRHYGLQ